MASIAPDPHRTQGARRVGLTCSPEVGTLSMHGCADHVCEIWLELDRNAPFIVSEPADLDIRAA